MPIWGQRPKETPGVLSSYRTWQDGGTLKEGHWGVEEGIVHVKIPGPCAAQREEAYVAGVERDNGFKEYVRTVEGCTVEQGLDLGLKA